MSRLSIATPPNEELVGVPPLPEQHRIVRVLDEAFAAIAKAKANTEKSLQNARALFDAHAQSILEGRVGDWRSTDQPLSALCDLIVDCEHKTAPTQEEGIPLIRTPNIGKGTLVLDGVYCVSEATYTSWTRRAEPMAGDLILGREAPAGNVAVVPENRKVCLGQRTVLIRPKRDVFVPEFLALFLLRPSVQKTLLETSRGATVQHVNMKDIRALLVRSIPTIAIQRDIISRVETSRESNYKLASAYQRKLTVLDQLKQSLLHQAFSGNL